MRLNLSRRALAQYEPHRSSPLAFDRLHRRSHDVPPLHLAYESRAPRVEQQATGPAQRFGGKELGLRGGIRGVDEARGVHLHLVEVAYTRGRGKGEREAEAVARGVITVGGRERKELGAVRGEDPPRGEVCCVAAGER